jgi:hypothetical protein
MMGRAFLVLAVALAGCGGGTTGDAGADAGGDVVATSDTGGGACERLPISAGAGNLAYDEPATGQQDSRGGASVLCAAEGADVVVCHDVNEQFMRGAFSIRLRFAGGWRVPAPGSPLRQGADFAVEAVTPWGRTADTGPWTGELIVSGLPARDGGVTPSLAGYACGARYRVGTQSALLMVFD